MRIRYSWVLAGALLLAGCQAASVYSGNRAPDGALIPKPFDFKDCPDCPEMVAMPSGRAVFFGSSAKEKDWLIRGGANNTWRVREVDQKPIVPGHLFAVGKYELTRLEFARFAEETGYETVRDCQQALQMDDDSPVTWKEPGFPQTDDHPAVCISWIDAVAYTKWLSRKTGARYRLPSEVEWEYAAKAGTQTMRYWGHDWENQYGCDYANVADRPNMGFGFECDDGAKTTQPVGSYLPNSYRIHDMLGNVQEWTADCWRQEHSLEVVPLADMSSEACHNRPIRGGGWQTLHRGQRPSFRPRADQEVRRNYYGVRLLREIHRDELPNLMAGGG